MAYELLNVEQRCNENNSFRLRKKGIIPGILYGAEHESIQIQIAERILVRCLKKGQKVFEIQVAGGEKHLINVGEIQKHPVKRNILHASFQTLNKDQETKVTIRIIITGEAEGIKKGGILVQQLNEVEIVGLPQDIPEMLTIDVSDLDVGNGKFIKDITPPNGIKFHKEDLDKTVATCNQPKAIEEETPDVVEGEEGAEGTEGEGESEGENSPEAKAESKE